MQNSYLLLFSIRFLLFFTAILNNVNALYDCYIILEQLILLNRITEWYEKLYEPTQMKF